MLRRNAAISAALFNLRVVFSHFAVPIEVTRFPQSNDPDLLARIVFPRSGSTVPDLGELFHAIKLRVTNRLSFAEEGLLMISWKGFDRLRLRKV